MKWLSDLLTLLGLLLKLLGSLLMLAVAVAVFALCVWGAATAIGVGPAHAGMIRC